MSNVYAAYGPVPTSVGVTASPRLNGSLDRRVIVQNRAATLGRTNPGAAMRHAHHRPSMGIGSSYQDLRRSRECLDMKQGPMEVLQPLEPLGVRDGVLHGSVEGFPAFPVTTLERRRNGGIVTGGCSVHGGTLTRMGSLHGSRYHLADERRVSSGSGGGCCRKSCCTLTLSLIACLLILGGVIVALYFFIKNVPYEHQPPSQEEPCEQHSCAWGGECQMDEAGVPFCACPTSCKAPSATTWAICGTDGITYISICELRKRSCSEEIEIRISHTGPCDEPIDELDQGGVLDENNYVDVLGGETLPTPPPPPPPESSRSRLRNFNFF